MTKAKARAYRQRQKIRIRTRLRRIRNALRARERHIYAVVASHSPIRRIWAAVHVIFYEMRRHYELTRPSLLHHISKQGRRKTSQHQRINLRRVAHMQRHAMTYSFWDRIVFGINVVRCEAAWRKARRKRDFSIVAPHMERLVKQIRETGKRKAEALGFNSTYDALVDEYTPGGYRQRFDSMMNELQLWLPDVVQRANTLLPPPDVPAETWALPPAIQEAVVRKIRDRMGLQDVKLGQSEHPLCLGAKGDIRVTITYNKDDFLPALLTAVHEFGHALYRQHLPDEWQKHPAGEVPSQAMDEAMALIMENHVGRSKGMAQFIVQTLRNDFGIERKDLTVDAVLARMTAIGGTKRRGDSDELSYPVHLMLRDRIGRELADGQLKVSDLPRRWREEEQKLFGWQSTNDREGCLQDIHWYTGQLGYFPSYFMGAMMAAQLYEQFGKDDSWGRKQAEQEFHTASLVNWLNEKVYKHASDIEADDLMRSVTGVNLSTMAYKRLVMQKYRPVQRMMIQRFRRFLSFGVAKQDFERSNPVLPPPPKDPPATTTPSPKTDPPLP